MHKIILTSKNSIYVFWGSLISFTTNIRSALIGLLLFVLLDTITGFIAAPYRGQKRNSQALSRFVTKLTTYFVIIIAGHVLEFMVFPDYAVDTVKLARLLCTAICGLEFYSTMENFYDITKLPIFRYITQLSVKKIKDATGVDVNQAKNGPAEEKQNQD